MSASLEHHCVNFRQYMAGVLLPALTDVSSHVRAGTVRVHHVFTANYFIAHAVDYILAIRKEDGFTGGRGDFVRQFDKTYSIGGARLGDRKFELIDAVNNALKHIRLDEKRYPHLEAMYGPISFNCLVQDNDKVLCLLKGFRFDYAKVVLMPAIRAFRELEMDTWQDVLAFARGEVSAAVEFSSGLSDSDPSDAIDRMIEYLNPECCDCGEWEEDCLCATYVFDGEAAKFEPMFDRSFDFDRVMSQISGAYRRSR